MKRVLLAALLVAIPAFAARDPWADAYNGAVKAINAKKYAEAVPLLQKALAERPDETASARSRGESFVYVPHYWLGIAKFNLGDFDGALREWKASEEQGAIEKTDDYSKLRDWVSRAQAEKVRDARNAAAGSKSAADAALSRALTGQVEALSAGGDRTDGYRAANRKLQEALALFNSAGTDIKTYERASATAADARELFARAADEAKKMRAARVTAPAPRLEPEPPPQDLPAQTTATAALTPKPQVVQPGTMTAATVTTASVPETSQSKSIVMPAAHTVAPRAQLESAYRAYATGDLNGSERALTSILNASASSEAYLLRGCTRYTRAMLSRSPEAGLAAARTDFKTALKLNRALRLDKTAFSPKLIAFFEQVRRGG